MRTRLRGAYWTAIAVLLVAAVATVGAFGRDFALADDLCRRIRDLTELHHIPGVSVAVVQGGEILLATGFGEADVEGRRAADENTVYLLASTSKLFVAVAVLQLVEQGLVDLHADVNRYLGTSRIPETYPEAISLHHLLTHTAGFEEMEWLAPGEPRIPLGEYLATHMPDRVRPPGVAWAYSNYGIGLAAHVVEEVRGMSFAEYADRSIFSPLGMTSTTYVDPLPAHLAERAAAGYGYEDDAWVRLRDDVPGRINLAPVGEAKSSASDMARFMLACLGGGALDGARILTESSAAELTASQFRMDERFAGICYAFHERIQDDVRMIHHGGDSLTFHTELLLVPERGLGVFVTFNGTEGVTARLKLMMRLHDELASPGDGEAAQGVVRPRNATRCAGDYLDTRRKYRGPEAVRAWWNRMLTFEVDALGRLYRAQAPAARFVEVDPLVFEEAGGPRTIVFVEDDDGEITHMFMPNFTTEAYERQPAWRTPRFVQQLAGAVALCAATILAAIRF